MKSKKILIIGSKEKFTLENMYFRAYIGTKHNVKILNIEKVYKTKIYNLIEKSFSYLIYNRIRKNILLYLKKNKKFDLIIFFKGLYLNKKFILSIREMCSKSKIVNIYTDNPLDIKRKNISNKSVLECIDQFDLFCVYSKKILKKIQVIKKKSKLLYLPFGFDKYSHKKGKLNPNFKNKINFIGSYDKKRLNFLKSLNNKDLFIAGDNWKIKNYNKSIFGSKLSSVITSSAASLNLLRDQNLTSHNMRTFEVPAMKGLLLTRRSKEQNIFFPENKASLMFSNLNELKKKIIFIKNNPKKVSEIRNKGYLISKKHSYTNRSIYLLKKIFYD